MKDSKTKGHVYIKPECELCDQTIHTDEWTVVLLGNEDGLSPSYLTNKFRFPESQDVVKTAGELILCQCPKRKTCERAHPSVTVHANCYRVFQQSYRREDAMDAIWVASAWKSPWRYRPPQCKPRLDLTDMTLVSIGGPAAEAIGISGLALLPSEVLQMVRSYIPDNLLWRYSLIQNIAEEMSRPFQNPFEPQHDATRFALAAVKAWKREAKGMDTTCDERTCLFGPYHCYTDTRDVSGNELSVLVHNVPIEGVGGSLGIVTEHNFGSEPLLSFPRYHNDDMNPLDLGCINTAAPAKNVTRADVYYDRRNGHCKGLLLQYANGAQRAIGQCRVGIDPFKAYEEPSWFCFRNIFDSESESLEENRSCFVECTTVTNNHKHEPCDIDDWQCMRAGAGLYLEFICDNKTDIFGMYIRHDEEEDDN
ncbi:hypothetical protein FPANT_9223 [Fusarium pseudoanthophilum]|uniref:Uncharacterized protein n=1 Tax=Fusarium pseudoanthophilum TaxID=48495 RepID=A0A8H5NVD9_9HYPO|nr:hypothetical protein FPANT_9223 [Fusarium pseudoanthophilum]